MGTGSAWRGRLRWVGDGGVEQSDRDSDEGEDETRQDNTNTAESGKEENVSNLLDNTGAHPWDKAKRRSVVPRLVPTDGSH